MSKKRLLPFSLVATALVLSSCGTYSNLSVNDVEEGLDSFFEDSLNSKGNTKSNDSLRDVEGGHGDKTVDTNDYSLKYDIAFVVGEKTIVKQFKYGETPVYGENDPTLEPTENTSYIFTGWNPEIKDVTDHAIYVAEFKPTTRKYKVEFHWGSTPKIHYFSYGESPYYAKLGGVKEEYKPKDIITDKYKRKFIRWEPDLAPVTCDMVYVGIYEESVRTYSISFVVDGKTTTKKFEYGSMPDFGSIPTKEKDENNGYVFKGWNPEFQPVTGGAKYTAEFTAMDKLQDITFVVDGKSVTKKCEWGEIPNYGSTPEKAATQEYTYSFDRWEPELQPVNGPKTYTAVFSKKKQKYEIVFKLNGEIFKSDWYDYGSTPSFNFSSDRIKYIKPYGSSFMFSIDDNARYVFNSWMPNINLVSKNQIYNASLSLVEPTAIYKCWTDDKSKINEHAHRWYTLFEGDGKEIIYQYNSAEKLILESTQWSGEISNKVLTISNGKKSLTLQRVKEQDKYIYYNL